MKKISCIVLVLFIWCGLFAQETPTASGIQFSSDTMPQYRTIINYSDDKLVYSEDELGNRIPDFSYCGYMASEVPIPDVPVRIIVPEITGDATGIIQKAINEVSELPLDDNGFRGAVLLEKGTFKISGSIRISKSGIVLRGSGCGNDGTILLGTGVDRETLIRIAGKSDRKTDEPIQLTDHYFPVNTTELVFKNPHDFKVGDRVIINRPSTSEWLKKIGTDIMGDWRYKWIPGDFDLNWDRTILSVSTNSITIDAPITNALDPQYGGGNVAKYTWKGGIRNIGVENLSCVSHFDKSNQKDENHRWMAITLENVCDAWVRRIKTKHFVSSTVAVWETARRITIEDCKSLLPVGEIGNFRRYAFHTLGQQVLFQRCYAEYAYHAFSVGFTSPGPNAFVQCYSYRPFNFSGAIGGWATGVLFDKMTIDGGVISLAFRDLDGQGGGWSAANSLCWQCRAAKIHLPSPPTAQNWAYGCWALGYGNGNHIWPHTFLKPESLFNNQLAERTGNKRSIETKKILVYESDETTAPMPEMSVLMSERSRKPDLVMYEWIDSMIRKYPIHSDISGAIRFKDIEFSEDPQLIEMAPSFALSDGVIVQNNKVVTGRRTRTALWRGTTRPSGLANPRGQLTRFVPGRTGRGLTDNLDTLTQDMISNQIFAMYHFPSLWYDRRRDDHTRVRRSDPDVWTPFYEQPFSRSGQGEAYDRLSKYDLTKWNPWYWLRLKQYADLADQKGLLLIQEHYLQHNIIEEGAHWVDYPWRSANNINDLGFAEPVHFSGDKRVYMAEEFYDTTHLVRKKFHREYIRKSLENFNENTNVIHHLGLEYTGPLHFVEFWLDVIKEWEIENKQNVLVMLPGTKDVQDAILSDPERTGMVEIIDILQWHYREDGSIYAPVGGQSLAARQYARIYNVGTSSFDQIYLSVSDYRNKYPNKAVVYSRRERGLAHWAVFLAGGSFAAIPTISDDAFLEMATGTKNYTVQNQELKQYVMEKKDTSYIIFSSSPVVNVEFCGKGINYNLKWIDPLSGDIVDHPESVTGSNRTVRAPIKGASIAWLYNTSAL